MPNTNNELTMPDTVSGIAYLAVRTITCTLADRSSLLLPNSFQQE